MATAPIKLRQHYQQLSENQTSQLVEAVADLIVTYLKNRQSHGSSQTVASATKPVKEQDRE